MSRTNLTCVIVFAAFAVGCAKPRAHPTPGAMTVAPEGDASTARAAPPDVPESIDGVAEERTIALPVGLTLALRTVGTGYIEVSLSPGAASVPGWTKIELERHTAADPKAVQRDALQHPPAKIAAHEEQAAREGWTRRAHYADPGTPYVYRARLGSGRWSPEVTLRSPAARTPPKAPTGLKVEPIGPFAARVTWVSTAVSQAGFEVSYGGAHVALLDPSAREFVHHGRLPGTHYSYAVRSFNARGPSAPSPAVEGLMPGRDARGGFTQSPSDKVGPCIPPIATAPKCAGIFPDIDDLNGKTKSLKSVPSPGQCLRRRLVGEYEGCTRELGVFTFQDAIHVEASPDDDEAKKTPDGEWPLLRAVAGAGQFAGGAVATLQFRKGHYVEADTVLYCGERMANESDPTLSPTDCSMDDLAQCAPPFVACQSPE